MSSTAYQVRDLRPTVTPEEEAAPPTPTVPRHVWPLYAFGWEKFGISLRGLKLVRHLFDEARRTYEQRGRGGQPICHYDDPCCAHRTPAALQIEAEDVYQRWQLLPESDRTTVQTQLDTWVHRQPRTPDSDGLAAQVAEVAGWPCPFSIVEGDERRCAIDAYKPLQCRAYGLFNPARETCAAPLVGTETAERRHVLVTTVHPWERAAKEDLVCHVQHLVTGFVRWLQTTAYGAEGASFPWLLYQTLVGREHAAAEVASGRIHRAIAHVFAAPPFLRWATRAGTEAGVVAHPEDEQLARDGAAPRWGVPILGGLGEAPILAGSRAARTAAGVLA